MGGAERKSPDSTPRLHAHALSDVDPSVRQAAGSTLSVAGARARPALPAMGRLLFDADQAVRLWTAMYVGRIGPDREVSVRKVSAEGVR